MSEENKVSEFGRNGLAITKWDNGKLRVRWFHGAERTFDPRRTSVTIRGNAEQYGFEVKLQRFGAIEIEKVPSRVDRSKEYERRWVEWVDHVYSGTDQWDLPRGPRQSGPTEADIVEAISRVFPGRGQALLSAAIGKAGGDLKAAIGKWLSTSQVAKAWGDIQAERRAAATSELGDADALLKELMGAEGGEA